MDPVKYSNPLACKKKPVFLDLDEKKLVRSPGTNKNFIFSCHRRMGEILPIRENLHWKHFSQTFNIATKFKEQRANFSFDFNSLPLHKKYLNNISI